MFCPNCGQQLPEGSRFCGSCGAQIAAAQPVQNASPLYNAPQYAPAYAAPQYNPQYAAKPIPEPKASPITWPPVIGILMIFAFLLSIASIAFFYRYFKYMGAPLSGMIIQAAVTLTCGMLAIILFFVPTRRVPAVTTIPRWIALLYSIISIVALFNQMRSAAVANLVTFFLFTLSPVILYTIGTASKPRTVTIAVIHLVLVVLSFTVSIFSFEWRMFPYGSSARSYYLLFFVLSSLASLVSGVAYTIALFFLRRKYYTELQ